MDALASFLSLVDAYKTARDVTDHRVSTLVFNDWGRISDIRDKKSDVGTRRLARAIQWFSDNWPDSAEWPAGVTRPQPAGVAA